MPYLKVSVFLANALFILAHSQVLWQILSAPVKKHWDIANG